MFGRGFQAKYQKRPVFDTWFQGFEGFEGFERWLNRKEVKMIENSEPFKSIKYSIK